MTTTSVRVGMVGTTPYAETHLARLAARSDVEVVAVAAGHDRARASELATRYAVPHVHMGWADLLVDDIDAVVIVAPDDLHEAIALAAIGGGRHVLCEKPLASTSAAAGRMASAAARGGVVAMSYFGLRTTPVHRYLAELVAEGRIGAVQAASFTLEHGMFRSPAYDWRFDADHGGGVVADLGCYVFDLARQLVGEVRSIAAHGASRVGRPRPDGRPYPPAADSCVGHATFDDAHATFQLGAVADVGPGSQRNVVILQGAAGRLELRHTFASSTLRIVQDGRDEELVVPAGFPTPSGDDDFIDAIISGRPVRPDFDDGLAVQRVVDACQQAIATGTSVGIPRTEEAVPS